jgi:hypothetical protein
MADYNYGGNGGRILIMAAVAAAQLNWVVAARAAAQTICKRGYRGQTHERMRGRLCSSRSRFLGCHSDSSGLLRLIGGCAF